MLLKRDVPALNGAEHTFLVNGLRFPLGIKIFKFSCSYYLKGENKGRSGDFVDGLPGYPDNIRSNGRGGFYVALAAPWNDQV